MNTNMTGFRCFQKSLHPRALDESSLSSVGRVKGTTGTYGLKPALHERGSHRANMLIK